MKSFLTVIVIIFNLTVLVSAMIRDDGIWDHFHDYAKAKELANWALPEVYNLSHNLNS